MYLVAVGHRRLKLRPVGNSPQSGGLVMRNLSPQTFEFLENLPRLKIRILKTKILGCQTKAKDAMWFFLFFLDPGFAVSFQASLQRSVVPCGAFQVSYAWVVNTRSKILLFHIPAGWF